MRKPLIWLLLTLFWPQIALAVTFNSPLAYPVQSQIVNGAGLAVGTTLAGQPTIPQVNQNLPPFSPLPGGPVFQRQSLFGDAIGRALTVITDGVLPISVTPPFRPTTPGQTALAVSLSPTPRLTCPYIQNINQTANTTVITNPGGKLIHVCNLFIGNGTTQQGVSIAEGTGTACGTGTTYWDGGSGGTVQPAASGGWVMPGQDVNYPMQKAGDNVCVLQSGSTNVSGHLTYGIY